MIFHFLTGRIFLVFMLPFTLGTLTVFSFQPYNYSYINFLIIPVLFLVTTYVKKKSQNTYRKKPYFNGAKLDLKNSSGCNMSIVQKGSLLIYNDEIIKAKKFSVKKMYEGIKQ